MALLIVDQAILDINRYSPIQKHPIQSFYQKKSIRNFKADNSRSSYSSRDNFASFDFTTRAQNSLEVMYSRNMEKTKGGKKKTTKRTYTGPVSVNYYDIPVQMD